MGLNFYWRSCNFKEAKMGEYRGMRNDKRRDYKRFTDDYGFDTV